jgi:hypothetical protein
VKYVCAVTILSFLTLSAKIHGTVFYSYCGPKIVGVRGSYHAEFSKEARAALIQSHFRGSVRSRVYDSEPSKAASVGGDYYRLIKRTDGRLLILAGDIENHGQIAAPSSLKIQAALDSPAMIPAFNAPTTTAILGAISETFQFAPRDRPTSMLAILFDPLTGQGEATAAFGSFHIYAIGAEEVWEIFPGGSYFRVCDPSEPFCIQEQPPAEPFSIAPREMLLVVSDGVTDRVNGEGQMLGQQMGQILTTIPGSAGPSQVLDHLLRGDYRSVDDEMALALQWDPKFAPYFSRATDAALRRHVQHSPSRPHFPRGSR